MATILGYKNLGSVRNAMGPLKKKILGGGSKTPAGRAATTPKKGAPKTARGKINGTPTDGRTNGNQRAHDTPLSDRFGSPNGGDSDDDSPTPKAGRRGKVPKLTPVMSNLVKRKADELDDSDEEGRTVRVSLTPRKTRSVSVPKRPRIKRERLHTDEIEDSEATTNSIIANSLSDPEWNDEI